MFILNMRNVNDIRASDIQDRTLVLGTYTTLDFVNFALSQRHSPGASKKAVYIPDIDTTNSPQYLHTKSDVFSVAQQRVCTHILFVVFSDDFRPYTAPCVHWRPKRYRRTLRYAYGEAP
jgi:hypothetical protein